MVACINPIIFPLPPGIKDNYNDLEYESFFENDGTSDRLVFKVLPEDYNAASPIEKVTEIGYSSAVTVVTRNLYEFEAVDRDQRSLHGYVLRDLLAAGGNLSVYGLSVSATATCNEPLIAVEDYHRLDEYTDELQGFTLRIGVLTVERLLGSYRKHGTNQNYNQGCRVIFTHTHKIQGNLLVPHQPVL